MEILVTGAAGFIGADLSQKLLSQGHKVVGVDNFNDYYDVSLKRARIDQLKSHDKASNVKIDEVDICNRAAISELFNNHKFGDYKPYIYRSDDAGQTWKSIKGNLPEGEYLWSIYQDHVNPDLLFLGAEYGLYFSIDGGVHWNKFTSGIPTIAIRDLEIQKRE
ncbi:MAG: GDP-mannose 4,6-dehydratase, partial [Acidiferrobacterales bacterium]|nr:GDP-mannose 4,6-dehydratase [Acidiferrobacterales bacterium]